MRIKEINVSSSKSLEFGEFKSSCTVVIEAHEGATIEEVREAVKQYQAEADRAVAYGLRCQIEAKAKRKASKGK